MNIVNRQLLLYNTFWIKLTPGGVTVVHLSVSFVQPIIPTSLDVHADGTEEGHCANPGQGRSSESREDLEGYRSSLRR
jgi:hypothetical protein